MPLEPEDLEWVRTFVTWDPPDDTALDDRFDADEDHGGQSREAVAVWFIRQRYFELLRDPANLSAPGVNIGQGVNITELSRVLQELEADLPVAPEDDPRSVTVMRLHRAGVDRG